MEHGVRKRGIEAGQPVQARDDGGLHQGICRGERGIWQSAGKQSPYIYCI